MFQIGLEREFMRRILASVTLVIPLIGCGGETPPNPCGGPATSSAAQSGGVVASEGVGGQTDQMPPEAGITMVGGIDEMGAGNDD